MEEDVVPFLPHLLFRDSSGGTEESYEKRKTG
jgi:hypothetical protein